MEYEIKINYKKKGKTKLKQESRNNLNNIYKLITNNNMT